jgi:hypothetical protein
LQLFLCVGLIIFFGFDVPFIFFGFDVPSRSEDVDGSLRLYAVNLDRTPKQS